MAKRGMHRSAMAGMAAALAFAASLPATPASAASDVTVALTVVGATTLAQGEQFRFQAVATNPGPASTRATVTFELTAPAGRPSGPTRTPSPLPFLRWQAKVPASGTATIRPTVVTSQWFTGTGDYTVTAQVQGGASSNSLAFTVIAPTVVVPRFQDVTAAAGIDATIPATQCGQYTSGAAWADVDGDGDLDLYITRAWLPAQLWINDGTGRFTEQASARGVDNGGRVALGATFADYDNDGDPDLLVTNQEQPNRLYRNDGTGHFTDVADAAGLGDFQGDSTSAAWGDYDGDGYLDLYVSTWSACLPPVIYEPDRLYHNEGDGTFTDQTALLPESSTFGAGFQPAWFDYNGDGRPDLYLANDHYGNDPDRNRLWRNDGPGVGGTWAFTDVSESSRANYSINSMGIGLADIDRDLDLDVAVSNIEGNVLARNNGDGTFTDVAWAQGASRPFQTAGVKSVTWGLAFADFNLDGWEDLFVAAGALDDAPNQPNQVFTADGTGRGFLDLSALSGADDPGSSRGLALADYDRDGLMDAVVVDKNGSAHLLRNVTDAPGSHWLEVRLTGTSSNRDGCGATLIATALGSKLMREVYCGSVGLSSGSDPTVHFGLASAATVSRLTIEWPSGVRQVLRNVAGDQLLEVSEPSP